MPRLRLLALPAFFFLCGLIAGCGRRETLVEAGVREKILHFGIGSEPASLDPHLVDASSDAMIEAAFMEGLCAIDEKTGAAVPASAERWECSADGLTWTFHLRAGLQWSNGDPLTADDFIQSWRRTLSPELATAYGHLFQAVRNASAFLGGQLKDTAQLGFAAPDPRTIIVSLSYPAPYLPMLTAIAAWHPVNPRVMARYGRLTDRANPWSRPENFVGNGPFLPTKWNTNAYLSARKNPRYWDAAKVGLEGIVFYPIENPDVEERTFRAGQLHVTYNLPLSKIPHYRKIAPDRLRVDPYAQTDYLRFNLNRPPFDNPRIRRALSLAINRELITTWLLHGSRLPAHQLVPEGLGGYHSIAPVPTDYEAARILLAEAGYPGGKGLPVLVMQTRNEEVRARIAEVIQSAWQKELGLAVEIEQMEMKVVVANERSLDYSMSFGGWVADFADPLNFLDIFVTHADQNRTGWSDPGFDQLIDRTGRTPDPQARLLLLQQSEKRLLDAAPLTPIVHSSRNFLIHPAVRGLEPSLIGIYQFKKIRLEP